MTCEIKVAKVGCDVSKGIPKNPERTRSGSIAHIQLGLASSYFIGAELQLDRCREIFRLKEGRKVVKYTQILLHEISSLLENLNTLLRYCNACGENYKLDKLWKHARNHIRHGVREELDNDTAAAKRTRLRYFKIPDHLQTSIEFYQEGFRIGAVAIKLFPHNDARQ